MTGSHVDADRADRVRVVSLVAHTHWDREWYHPAVRFQSRLVALLDAVLEAPTDPATPFLLDGQTIVLSDYLAIRPERTADVARALSAGALEAGPWYVLADNLMPSGEAIVRNLEAGRRWLRRLGVATPRVAYCPDTFGHPAALPLVAAGFGCDVAIVWRGFGGRSFPPVDTVWWEGPDDSRVLLHHLPPDGYEFGSALPDDDLGAAARWQRMRTVLNARNGTGTVLLPVGADHHAMSPTLPTAVRHLVTHALADGARVTRGSLAQAAGALHLAAHAYESHGRSLPVVRGELRDSYGYTWTLQGTFATRAAQKRANARLERALLRDVEPWLALAWLHAPVASRSVAPDGSITLAQLPTLLQHTWEALLRTHPHDTLCGCSIDHVAADMSGRQRDVSALTIELREAALHCALSHDRVAARERPIRSAPPTVVRNRAARVRGGLAELTLIETLADVQVGPGSANAAIPAGAADPVMLGAHAEAPPTVDGCVVQRVSTSVAHRRRESPQHYPDDDLVRVHRVLAWVPEVPAFGLRVLGSASSEQVPLVETPTPVVARRVGDTLELDNGRVRVIASREGITILSGARRLTNALAFETVVDAGDSYTPSLRGEPVALELSSAAIGAPGPLRASIRLGWRWRDGGESIRVQADLVLDAGSALVRCDVRGRNRRRNHRLQCSWRTDVSTTQVWADAAFGPVPRTTIPAVADATPFERPPTTMPLHRWMSVSDASSGATLVSDGLAEGEAGPGRLAVTLVRAIGELSKNDLPERPGHAGWPAAIPGAQCIGRFAARLGLLLHDAWSEQTHDLIEQAADDLLLPLVGESWRDFEGPPSRIAGPMLEGDGLRVSAVCLSDDGAAMRLRAANTRHHQVSGRWTLPKGEWRARACRLDGTPEGPWRTFESQVAFEAPACAVVTIEVRRSGT